MTSAQFSAGGFGLADLAAGGGRDEALGGWPFLTVHCLKEWGHSVLVA